MNLSQIEFRARRRDTGAWAYGLPVRTPGNAWLIRERHENGPTIEPGDEVFVEHEVDPATIGQFVGRYDSLNRKMFTGDVRQVVLEDDEGGGTACQICTWLPEWSSFEWMERGERERCGHDCLMSDAEGTPPVCGNIFDSPEYLDRTEP